MAAASAPSTPLPPVTDIYLDTREIKPSRRKSFDDAGLDTDRPPSSAAAEQPESTKAHLTEHDKRELKVALEVFGKDTVKAALNKSPGVKEKAVLEILDRIRGFEADREGIKPGKMMRGASQIVARILREKVLFLRDLVPA